MDRLKYIKEYIESFEGYILLSKEYTNNKKKLLIKCPEGHEFEMTYNAFQRGQRCKICGNNVKSQKMRNKFEKVKEYIESFEGYRLLSREYINNTSKLLIKCPEGHEFWKSYNSFQNGQRCVVCFNLKKRSKKLYSYDYIKEYIGSFKGYKLLSKEYRRSNLKLLIECPEGHKFEMTYNSFQQGCRCPECGNVNKKNQPHKNSYEEVKRYIESFKGYKLLSKEYKNTNSKLLIKCPEGHEFEKSFKLFKFGERCYKCFYSKIEKEVFDFVFNVYRGEIKENDRTLIYPLELDIYLPDQKLAIEFNGLYWHSSFYKDKNYHLNKTELCEKKGIQLLHIFENEWKEKQDIVKSVILSKLGIYKQRIYARKCIVKEIDTKTKNQFLQENHLQGSDKSSVKLGLFYKNKLVSVMTFGKSRFNKNYEWELIRYCSKLNTSILGGASKLFKHFKIKYYKRSIISYSDKRYSNGKLYKILGFNHLYNSKPNYFYFKGNLIKSRISCQKHKLKNFLDNFDPLKTEHENMIDNGYKIIYDCGNMVFLNND